MTQLIHHYPHNEFGRDFVCGDIHGHFEKLTQELQNVHFDESKDRLFLLGDLIDRGPKSVDVIKWLNKPFVHSIMGNHELLALWSTVNIEDYWSLQGCAQRNWHACWMDNGGEWWNKTSAEDQEHILSLLKKLPLVIEVMVGNKKIGLIHADSYHIHDWNNLPALMQKIDNDPYTWTDDMIVQMLVWNRDRFNLRKYCDGQPVDNIDHVYHGHSIVRDPFHTHNVSFIDTGPNMVSGKLTLINLTERHK